jgi:hypothetical protein
MFTLDGYASVILPVDEGESMVTGYLDGSAPKKAVAKAAPKKAEPKVEPVAKPKAEKAKVVKTPSSKAPAEKAIATTKPKKEKTVASGGDGTLMIGAKPPCQIIIDGRNTGLTTPQRALDLSAGKHKVTLVNKEHGIKESFTVSIKAGQSTRVVKDLTSKM